MPRRTKIQLNLEGGRRPKLRIVVSSNVRESRARRGDGGDGDGSADVVSFDLPYLNGPAECVHLMSFISPLASDLAVAYLPMMPVRLVELLLATCYSDNVHADADLLQVDPVTGRRTGLAAYVRKALRALASRSDPAVHAALAFTDLLIDGPYIEPLAEGAGEWRGSRNQRIIALPGLATTYGNSTAGSTG